MKTWIYVFTETPQTYLECVKCSLRTHCPPGFLQCRCTVYYQSGAHQRSSRSLKAKQWTWGVVRGRGQRDGENTTICESLKIYSGCVLGDEASLFLKQYFPPVSYYWRNRTPVFLVPGRQYYCVYVTNVRFILTSIVVWLWGWIPRCSLVSVTFCRWRCVYDRNPSTIYCLRVVNISMN